MRYSCSLKYFKYKNFFLEYLVQYLLCSGSNFNFNSSVVSTEQSIHHEESPLSSLGSNITTEGTLVLRMNKNSWRVEFKEKTGKSTPQFTGQSDGVTE